MPKIPLYDFNERMKKKYQKSTKKLLTHTLDDDKHKMPKKAIMIFELYERKNCMQIFVEKIM